MGYQGKPEKNNKKHNPDDGALCYLIDAIIIYTKFLFQFPNRFLFFFKSLPNISPLLLKLNLCLNHSVY